jgi:hypothetical protein
MTLGRRILMDRGLNFSSYFYWISIGALIGFIMLFNIGFATGLTVKRRKCIMAKFFFELNSRILTASKYN